MDNHVALAAEQGREIHSSTAFSTQYPGDWEYRERERAKNQIACDKLLARLIEHHSDKHKIVQLVPKEPEKAEEPKPQAAPIIPLPVRIPEPAESVRLPSIFIIMHEASKFYDVPVLDIKSSRRQAVIVKPRQIGMYLSRMLTLRSFPEIGMQFGGRDHTTVLHAVRKIAALVETDERLNDEIEILKLRIAEVVLNYPQ